MMISESMTMAHTPAPLFSSSVDMRIHPLSASPATSAFFQTGTSLTDDVTTIFVVGFPDDMTEREFHNMFMFCPGFEAASLKWHCKDQEDDNSVGSNGGKKQIIGFARFRTRLEAMEAAEVLGGKKVDQDKGTILKAEMAKKNLHIKRGSIAPTASSLLPSLQSSSSFGSPTSTSTATLSSTVPTTLPIGSASTAVAAEVPTISSSASASSASSDTAPATGSAMSRETTTTTATTAVSALGEGTMSLLSKKLGRHPATTSSASSNSSYDTFSPLPSDLLSPADYKTDPFMNDPFTSSTPTTPIFSDSLFGSLRSNSFDARQPDIGLMSPPRQFGSSGGIGIVNPSLSSSYHNNNSNNVNSSNGSNSGSNGNISNGGHGLFGFNQGQSAGHNNNNFMMGPSPLAKANNFGNLHHPLQHHPLQQQHPIHHPYQTSSSSSPFNNAADDDAYNYLSKSSPVSNDRLFGTSPLFDDLMASRMGSLTMQANNLTDLRSPSISSIHRPSNPADQNPPCNTLYVGNLPPNTNEDEIRQLFSQCQGYKRMCFRNKPQGPMCFVEFEDVVLATKALTEHQGHCLTTSVKGGIRLSFSKNPLFIKGPNASLFTTPNGNSNNSSNGKVGVSSFDS